MRFLDDDRRVFRQALAHAYGRIGREKYLVAEPVVRERVRHSFEKLLAVDPESERFGVNQRASGECRSGSGPRLLRRIARQIRGLDDVGNTNILVERTEVLFKNVPSSADSLDSRAPGFSLSG